MRPFLHIRMGSKKENRRSLVSDGCTSTPTEILLTHFYYTIDVMICHVYLLHSTNISEALGATTHSAQIGWRSRTNRRRRYPGFTRNLIRESRKALLSSQLVTEEDREKEEEEYLKKKNEWQRKRNEWVSPEAVKERRQKRRAKFVENRDNTLYPAYEFRKRLNSCLHGVVEAADRRLNLTGIDDLKLETLEYQPSLGLKTDGGITLNVDVDRIVLSFLFDYERPDMGKSYDKDDKRPFYEEADRDDVVYDDDGYVAMDTYQNSRHESLGRFFYKNGE